MKTLKFRHIIEGSAEYEDGAEKQNLKISKNPKGWQGFKKCATIEGFADHSESSKKDQI